MKIETIIKMSYAGFIVAVIGLIFLAGIGGYYLKDGSMKFVSIWFSVGLLLSVLFSISLNRILYPKPSGIIARNVCSICGQTRCNHINAPRTNIDLARMQPYFMGVDYADRIDSHRIYSQRRQDARNYYDEQVRRYQELMVQQVALQPPQPIILTAQQNRRSDVSANNNIYDWADIGRLYANNYGSNGQPPPKPEVKEPPKVEPIPPRKILSAISTLEIGE